jgi:hypothetical protein
MTIVDRTDDRGHYITDEYPKKCTYQNTMMYHTGTYHVAQVLNKVASSACHKLVTAVAVVNKNYQELLCAHHISSHNLPFAELLQFQHRNVGFLCCILGQKSSGITVK